MKQKIYGVVPPISTPIDEHEHVDEKALRKLIDHCIDKGLHGIFVCGTNGECLGLTQPCHQDHTGPGRRARSCAGRLHGHKYGPRDR